MEIAGSPNLDILGLLNRAIGFLEEGHAEEIRSSKITLQAKRKILEEKRKERIDKIMENLGRLQHGKCLGFLKVIAKVASFVTAPLGVTSLALGLGSLLLDGLDRLQQAKNQRNYLLSKKDQELLAEVIEEVKKLFDDEIESGKGLEEQKERELMHMKETIETAVENYQKTTTL